jgi:hypothetical protein
VSTIKRQAAARSIESIINRQDTQASRTAARGSANTRILARVVAGHDALTADMVTSRWKVPTFDCSKVMEVTPKTWDWLLYVRMKTSACCVRESK